MNKYENFGLLVLDYARLFSELTENQDGMSPKVFNKFADSVFKDFHNAMKVFYAENNYRLELKKAKHESFLKMKEWRKQMKEKNKELRAKKKEQKTHS